ncbi:MAG: hypothetical protein R2789_10645 [Microthrixaceae bacterium]
MQNPIRRDRPDLGALANVEDTFTDSAAVTGGWRGVRWVTDSGSAGCGQVLRTAANQRCC